MHSSSLSKAAMPNSGALGYPSEPQLERKRICREAPPVAPASSQPSTSAEPRMAIPFLNIESCRSLETLTASQSSLAQEMAAIRACQEQMLATQAQHTAILRQLQLHFDLPPAVSPPLLPQQCHTLIPQSLRPH
ncbi:hypothetical protein CK203_115954 [Vitis vinifera]|uniref:Uncharacterized protein n=1 Tax=Vitis vinifera TaxID=29760 RepID=A0A438EIU6_VITVI|nr:hypothetical protein CK203_115954 [Vitis vinifera]